MAKKKKITIQVSPELHRAAKTAADALGTNLTAVLTKCLERLAAHQTEETR